MRFLVTLEPDEDGSIVVDCPALPGCVSQGRTQQEALRNIGEAIQVSLETRRANGLPIGLEVAEIEVEVPSQCRGFPPASGADAIDE
jgi:predicted RNase H-like HicB family nuclease